MLAAEAVHCWTSKGGQLISSCRPSRLRKLTRRITSTVALLSAVVAVASTAMAVAPGSASACSASAHCYGRALWQMYSTPGAGVYGIATNVRSNCMYVADPSTEFVTNEVWAINGTPWVEAGITAGAPFPNSPTAFAARGDSTGSYRSWNLGGVATNTYYSTQLWQDASLGQWWMQVGSAGVHTSALTGDATDVRGGLEADSYHTTNQGSVSDMRWESLSRNWYTGWGTSNTPAPWLQVDSGTYANWVTTNQWVQMGTNAC